MLREKKNMSYTVLKNTEHKDSNIITDETISLSLDDSKNKYPENIRRVTAVVEVEVEFLQTCGNG